MGLSIFWKRDSKNRPVADPAGENRRKRGMCKLIVRALPENVRRQTPAYFLPLTRSTQRGELLGSGDRKGIAINLS